MTQSSARSLHIHDDILSIMSSCSRTQEVWCEILLDVLHEYRLVCINWLLTTCNIPICNVFKETNKKKEKQNKTKQNIGKTKLKDNLENQISVHIQWHSQHRGKEVECSPDSKKIGQKLREKIEKKRDKSRKKRQNQEGSFTLPLLADRAGYTLLTTYFAWCYLPTPNAINQDGVFFSLFFSFLFVIKSTLFQLSYCSKSLSWNQVYQL